MEVNIGEYVRTETGLIGIITEVSSDTIFRVKFYDNIPFKTDIYETPIKAHSKNIIDLIEVGDYVNGDEVIAIDYNEDENGNTFNVLGVYDIDDDYAYTVELRREHIKTILTHEQYEQNCYKVVE